VLALTDHLGQELIDARGRRVGRVRDLAVRLGERFPAVVALVADVGGAERRIPWSEVATFEGSQVALRADLPAAAAEPRDELRLRRDVLDTQVVDVDGRRVARVGEVQLTREGDLVRTVAVNIGLGAVLRRLGLGRLARRARADALAWDEIHLASGRGHQLQLATPTAAVHHLSPDELMQLVGRLPVARGAEVLQAVTPVRAAGALGGSRPGVAAGLLRALDLAAAPEILARMSADDVASVLRPLDEPERERALGALEPARADAVRQLLEQRAGTAGSIMSPGAIPATTATLADRRPGAPRYPFTSARRRAPA
jgi:sporulation protein YlmC with PRC-barrel domain